MKKFRLLAALFIALAIFDGSGLTAAVAAPSSANPTKVFLSDCGHYLSNKILYYWRTHGRQEGIGCPVSEEVGLDGGGTAQYFKKYRLEYHPENAGSQWEYSYGLIGSEYLATLSPEEKTNSAYQAHIPFDNEPNSTYYPETGHTLSFALRDYWKANNGLYNFGLPITEEYSYFNGDKTYSAQLFERGRLLYSAETGVVVDEFGPIAAQASKIDTSAQKQDPAIPVYNVNLWEHWVDVNLNTFTIKFMDGDIVVRQNRVIIGTAKNPTPTGTFYVRTRIANEHMRGGEIGTEDFYDLDNVLYTQYFTGEGHALHYAWWRSSFGYAASHGCVNMDLDTSYFAWNWLTFGSRIVIHR